MEQFAFISGNQTAYPGPLARYLPPLPLGCAAQWLAEVAPIGSWILDPFGASPRLAVDAAQAGYRVLVASNNPIDRFVIKLAANPISETEFRSSLADLSAAMKGDQRIEPMLRGLYATPCSNCQYEVSADAFVWNRGAAAPVQRIYHCPNCGETGEFPISPSDESKLAQLPSSQLHRARALERVTPLDDPDRQYVEEALDVYLPRALYALFTLINKLDSLPPARKLPLTALLLSVFDQANTLWAYPTQRARPRQLSTPPRFIEKNVWLAMEESINTWINSYPANSAHLPVTTWPQEPPETGGICLYGGRLRDLNEEWNDHDQAGKPESIQLKAVLAPLPRPNQAFWTFSALWSGWLWGREAAAPFKIALRRRRYDWNWHCSALQASFEILSGLLVGDIPILGLIGETEPGFISAALLAADLAGLELTGIALRTSDDQTQIVWRHTGKKNIAVQPNPEWLNRITTAIQRAGLEYLRLRGEPASYLQLHTAALSSIIQEKQLIQETLVLEVQHEAATPAEILSNFQNCFQQALSFRNGFVRIHGSPNSLETGQWWLREAKGVVFETVAKEISLNSADNQSRQEIAVALSDRIEMEIVRLLLKQPAYDIFSLYKILNSTFRGLDTPDTELIQVCLDSYAEKVPDEIYQWRLRAQETPHLRRTDLNIVTSLIHELGKYLNFETKQPDPTQRWIEWLDQAGEVAYAFYPLVSAVIGSILSKTEYPTHKCVIVYPGGRAGLISYKLRSNFRLQSLSEQGWRFLKFRHLRLMAQSEQLSRQNLDGQLLLDPMANQDPQISFM